MGEGVRPVGQRPQPIGAAEGDAGGRKAQESMRLIRRGCGIRASRFLSTVVKRSGSAAAARGTLPRRYGLPRDRSLRQRAAGPLALGSDDGAAPRASRRRARPKDPPNGAGACRRSERRGAFGEPSRRIDTPRRSPRSRPRSRRGGRTLPRNGFASRRPTRSTAR